MNHDGSNEDNTNTQIKRTMDKNDVDSESQIQAVNATASSQLVKEQNYSQKSVHQHSERLINSEELISYQKRQRTKKRHRKSKQKQVCRKHEINI